MRQECKNKEENGDLKAYKTSQRSNNSSSNIIITKSQQKQIFFFNKQKEVFCELNEKNESKKPTSKSSFLVLSNSKNEI